MDQLEEIRREIMELDKRITYLEASSGEMSKVLDKVSAKLDRIAEDMVLVMRNLEQQINNHILHDARVQAKIAWAVIGMLATGAGSIGMQLFEMFVKK